MLDNKSTKGELRISARHFAHCNEKAFEVALWKQTILQTKEMDLKNIAEGTTDPSKGRFCELQLQVAIVVLLVLPSQKQRTIRGRAHIT